jgi:thymidine kinase
LIVNQDNKNASFLFDTLLNSKTKGMASNGDLTLILGPMFSGKTTDLCSRLTTRSDVGDKCLFIGPSKDNRSELVFSTHSSTLKSISEKIHTVKVTTLESLSSEFIQEQDVIGVDEGQFFPDLVPSILKWVNQYNKAVFVAGLNGDFLARPFGTILELIPHANHVNHLYAICLECRQEGRRNVPANYSALIKDVPMEKGVIHVGGADTYSSMCRHHYNLHCQ